MIALDRPGYSVGRFSSEGSSSCGPCAADGSTVESRPVKRETPCRRPLPPSACGRRQASPLVGPSMGTSPLATRPRQAPTAATQPPRTMGGTQAVGQSLGRPVASTACPVQTRGPIRGNPWAQAPARRAHCAAPSLGPPMLRGPPPAGLTRARVGRPLRPRNGGRPFSRKLVRALPGDEAGRPANRVGPGLRRRSGLLGRNGP